MYFVFGNVVGVYKDVVEISSAEDVQEGAEYVIDEVLKSGGGVCQAERHNQGFKQSPSCTKSGFPNIVISYSYQIVSTSNVQCSIDFGFGKLIQGFSDEGERVSVLDCSSIKATIIDAKA